MTFPKFNSASSLSLAGVVLLVGGLGVAIFASQQQQDQRSKAAGLTVGDTVPGTPVTVSGKNAAGTDYDSKVISGLTVGVRYKIVASGVVYYQGSTGRAYDPEYSDVGTSTIGCFCVRGGAPLVFNNVNLESSEQSSQSSHKYTYYWTADTTSLDIRLYDSPNYYYDNSGSITISMIVDKLPESTKTPTPTVTKTPTKAPNATTLSFDLLFHGIGKGGDNANPNGGGNPNPLHPTRSVVVDVLDLDENVIIEGKQGQVAYDAVSGSYKGEVAMGTTLTTGAYQIRVKLSQSLRKSISRNITAGTTNVIPQMILVNGDTNNDAKIDIVDYSIIQGCYSDFDLPPADCDATRKAQGDIDDDGKVNQFDLNLFLREMSVQQL